MRIVVCLSLSLLVTLGSCRSSERRPIVASMVVSPVPEQPKAPVLLPSASPQVPIQSSAPLTRVSYLHKSSPTPMLGSSEPRVFSSPLDNITNSSIGSSSGRGASVIGDIPLPEATPAFYIRDIVLSQNDESIMGSDATTGIKANYKEDSYIDLKIIGNFATQSLFNDLTSRFSFETGLVHQTFNGNEPLARVLLDGVRILKVKQIQPNYVEVQIPTLYYSDLYLIGQHQISIQVGKEIVTKPIKVDLPIQQENLSPQILEAEIIKNNNLESTYLRIKGKHFLINPNWQNVWIGLVKLPVLRTEILSDGISFCWVDLSTVSLSSQSVWIRYDSPFGSTLYELEVR